MIRTPARRGRGLGPLPTIPGVRLHILAVDEWLAGSLNDRPVPVQQCSCCTAPGVEIWRVRHTVSFDGTSLLLCDTCKDRYVANPSMTITREFRCA